MRGGKRCIAVNCQPVLDLLGRRRQQFAAIDRQPAGAERVGVADRQQANARKACAAAIGIAAVELHRAVHRQRARARDRPRDEQFGARCRNRSCYLDRVGDGEAV